MSQVTTTFVASDGVLTSNPVSTTIAIAVPTGQVLGNRLFYNNSKYDGNNGAINAADDAALASDKIGFDGTGTATFANVSGSNRGITGIMVDIASGLGSHGLINLTSGDLSFLVAPAVFVTTTYNQLSTWTAAPTPANVSVRLGAGVGGSDRLEITWANSKITNTWLAVTVAANAHTGLSSPDTFYFGSAVGDTGIGNTAGLAKVDGNDYNAPFNNIAGVTTPVWNVNDLTKDGKVDGSDANVAINGIFSLHYLANVVVATPSVDLNGSAGGTGFTAIWAQTGAVNLADSAAAAVSGAGGANLLGLTVTLASATAFDVLTANTVGTNISASYSAGTLLLSGSDTAADYQQVLRSVRYYNNAPGGPGVELKIASVVAFDGFHSSPVAMATITVPPVVNLTVGAAAPNFTTSWYNSGPVPIQNMVQAAITDPAGLTSLSSLTVTLATFHTGDVLSVPTLASVSIATSYSAGTLTLSGANSLMNYQKLLRLVSYDNSAGVPSASPITAVFVASDGTVASRPVSATINISAASGQVLGNRLFYNNSKYDGNSAAINAADDAAIASDKVGFAGTGTATFANVSAAMRGITGIMVDLAAGIGTHGAINLTSGDITFKLAPSFTTTTYNQLSTWTTAPTPSAISVRLGAGTGGSDRIEITWPNGAILNTWLEVFVAADANTGLSTPDVFYFGSAEADSGAGDTPALAKTDGTDYNAPLNNITGLTTPVWNVMDYTKDGKVDGSDANMAINGISSLHYIANPTGPFSPAPSPDQIAGVATIAAATDPIAVIAPSTNAKSDALLSTLSTIATVQFTAPATPGSARHAELGNLAMLQHVFQRLDSLATRAEAMRSLDTALVSHVLDRDAWLDDLLSALANDPPSG